MIEEKVLNKESVEGLELGEWDGQVVLESLLEDVKKVDGSMH